MHIVSCTWFVLPYPSLPQHICVATKLPHPLSASPLLALEGICHPAPYLPLLSEYYVYSFTQLSSGKCSCQLSSSGSTDASYVHVLTMVAVVWTPPIVTALTQVRNASIRTLQAIQPDPSSPRRLYSAKHTTSVPVGNNYNACINLVSLTAFLLIEMARHSSDQPPIVRYPQSTRRSSNQPTRKLLRQTCILCLYITRFEYVNSM